MSSWIRPGLLIATLAWGLGGCVRVQPYQREILARPDMALGSFGELEIGSDHAKAYREGSNGGARVRAGGCGCN
jgi:hypothetical protein